MPQGEGRPGLMAVMSASVCAIAACLALAVTAAKAQERELVPPEEKRGPPAVRDRAAGEAPKSQKVLESFGEEGFREELIKGVRPDIRNERSAEPRPDLVLGPCEVLCDRGTGYSAEVCERYGYSDQFAYMARAKMSNAGQMPASFAPGVRIWGTAPMKGLRSGLHREDPERQNTPPGGLALEVGAEMPGPHRPMLFNLLLASGPYSVIFIADPDGRIDEAVERNNTSECLWEVVAAAPESPFDLAITNIEVSPKAGPPSENFEITVTVENRGRALLDAVNAVCHPGGSFLIAGMDEGEEAEITYLIPGVPSPGKKKVICTVRSDSYSESDTSNNTETELFTVTQP